MRSYPVKQNRIGSVVTKIIWYKQTDKIRVITVLIIVKELRGKMFHLI